MAQVFVVCFTESFPGLSTETSRTLWQYRLKWLLAPVTQWHGTMPRMPRETTGSEEAASRSPRCSGRERSADEEPPESTLKIEEFTVSWQRPGVPCWENEAFKIFQRAGFVIVNDVLTDDQSEKVLKTCEDVARQIIEIDPRGNRAKGRYSIGTAFSSGSSLHLPEFSEHLLGAGVILEPLLCKIFHKDGKADFQCYSGGGDFVVPGVEEYQPLHGDIEVKFHDEKMPPPFVSVNFCVQPLTTWNGPIRMVPGKTRLDWDGRTEPIEWRHSRLCPVPVGAALLRDVRILHGGTPNLSNKIRFLPSVEFVSESFQIQYPEWWPPVRCITQRTYDALDKTVQRRCKGLVADDGADVENVKIVRGKWLCWRGGLIAAKLAVVSWICQLIWGMERDNTYGDHWMPDEYAHWCWPIHWEFTTTKWDSPLVVR